MIPKGKEYKYYTPKDNEFHIGFEFECLDGPSVTEFKIYKKRTLSSLDDINQILFCHPRVKRLNGEDLVKLGLEKHGGLSNTYYLDESQNTANVYGIIYISLNDETGHTLIEDDRTSYHLFRGYIKNKSEMKRVLEQLKIN